MDYDRYAPVVTFLMVAFIGVLIGIAVWETLMSNEGVTKQISALMLLIIGFIVIYIDKVGVMVKRLKAPAMHHPFANCRGTIREGPYDIGERRWRFVVTYWVGYIHNRDVLRRAYPNVFYRFMGIMTRSVTIEMTLPKVMFQKVTYGNDPQGGYLCFASPDGSPQDTMYESLIRDKLTLEEEMKKLSTLKNMAENETTLTAEQFSQGITSSLTLMKKVLSGLEKLQPVTVVNSPGQMSGQIKSNSGGD